MWEDDVADSRWRNARTRGYRERAGVGCGIERGLVVIGGGLG